MSDVRELPLSQWERLLDHTVLTPEWVSPANQDAVLRQLVLLFYPVIVGSTVAMAEQAYAAIAVSGYELRKMNLAKPSEAMLEEKTAQAKLALRDLLASVGLDRGVLQKNKRRAHKDSFKWPYQSSEFGGAPDCDSCGRPSAFRWHCYRGDWTVRCSVCGHKDIFRKARIDKTYLDKKREAQRENTKVRPFASSEDDLYFYMKLRALYVPVDPHNSPTHVIIGESHA